MIAPAERSRSKVTLPTASALRPLIGGTSWLGLRLSLNTGVAESAGFFAVAPPMTTSARIPTRTAGTASRIRFMASLPLHRVCT